MTNNNIKQDTIFINGNFVDKSSANISVFDRGFLFADGIYEVIPVCSDKPYFIDYHLDRMQNNLNTIDIKYAIDKIYWSEVIKKLVASNGPNRGVYIQITRGADIENLRTHAPSINLKPTLVAFSLSPKEFGHSLTNQGVFAITHEDIRWKLCNIKSVSLLASSILSKKAFENEAFETILIKDNYVTEGTSSNLFIVKNNEIMTPILSNEILPGITRQMILDLALSQSLIVKYSKISLEDLYNADEVWISGQIKELLAVVKLDNKVIGSGKPGPVWKKMSQLYIEKVKQSII